MKFLGWIILMMIHCISLAYGQVRVDEAFSYRYLTKGI